MRTAAVAAMITAVVSALVSINMYAASPKDRINEAARHAKAIRYVETAEALDRSNELFTPLMFLHAVLLAPTDSTVIMASSNQDLMFRSTDNPLYFQQLDMLEHASNPSKNYYYVLMQNTTTLPPADSLTNFRTALAAYRRFPKQEEFLDWLLSKGSEYIINKRFRVHADDRTVDTLDLTPDVVQFADDLFALADSVEQKDGYSYIIDRFRLFSFKMLDREKDLDLAEQAIWERDSTDARSLELLASMAKLCNKDEKFARYTLQQFRVNPDAKNVYDVYVLQTNDSLRAEFMDAVLDLAGDVNGDVTERMRLLMAAANAYYEVNDKLDAYDRVPTLDRISEAVREITREDPKNLNPYIVAIIMAKNVHWGGHYGYIHWMDAFDAIPDSLEDHFVIAQSLASVMPKKDAELEKRFLKLNSMIHKERPDLALDMNIVLGHYYMVTKQYPQAAALFGPITIEDIRNSQKLRREYIEKKNADKAESAAEQPEADDDVFAEVEDTEGDPVKRWIALQSVLSSCLMEMGKTDQAFTIMNGILAIDPKNAEILNNLAYYMALQDKDLNVALSLVNRSLDESPENYNAIDTRAWIYYKQGKVDEALNDMARIFKESEVDIFEDILSPDAKDPVEVVFENFNKAAIAPILGHILVMADKSGKYDAEVIKKLAAYLESIDPENEDLAAYKAKYQKKPKTKSKNSK